MRWLILTLLALTAGVSVALLADRQPGYLLLNVGQWTIETTAVFASLAIAALFITLYLLLRLIINTLAAPAKLSRWHQRRKRSKANKSFETGLLALASGNWRAAEKYLTQAAMASDSPTSHYLLAARSAQAQGNHRSRDRYLKMANNLTEKGDIAIALTQAELQIEHGQLDDALGNLQHIRRIAPRNVHALVLLLKLYQLTDDWQHLSEILPLLRKKAVLSEKELRLIDEQVYAKLLQNAASIDAIAVTNAWQQTPKQARLLKPVFISYIYGLLKYQEGQAAEQLLYRQLNHSWDSDYAYLYGLAEGTDSAAQLAKTERFLLNYPDEAMMLLSAGRLCLRNQLWGKARNYLDNSATLAPRAETYQLLAEMLTQLGETEDANHYYRLGLNKAASHHMPELIQQISTPQIAGKQAG